MTMHVFARAIARPESRGALQTALRDNMLASRQEPGCVRYELAQGLADANEFLTIEEWRSEADVAAHMRTPHVAALLAKVPSLVTAPPEIRSYRTLA
ncbi:MAG TPA: putative quinol monooxygenase [Planctomycetota bacterium]